MVLRRQRFLFWQEEDYVPLVKDMIALLKNFNKPFGAANAIAKQATKKPAAKGKAKAKA